ncbi:MAG: hypothetical protein ABID61_00890 [Candidatus Micrarchaeota archaeon]
MQKFRDAARKSLDSDAKCRNCSRFPVLLDRLVQSKQRPTDRETAISLIHEVGDDVSNGMGCNGPREYLNDRERQRLSDALLDYHRRYPPQKPNTKHRSGRPEPSRGHLFLIDPATRLCIFAADKYVQRILELQRLPSSLLPLSAHQIMLDMRVLAVFGLNRFTDAINDVRGDPQISLDILQRAKLVQNLTCAFERRSITDLGRDVPLLHSAGVIGAISESQSARVEAVQKLAEIAIGTKCTNAVYKDWTQEVARRFMPGLDAVALSVGEQFMHELFQRWAAPYRF